jgi:hypothetical protein
MVYKLQTISFLSNLSQWEFKSPSVFAQSASYLSPLLTPTITNPTILHPSKRTHIPIPRHQLRSQPYPRPLTIHQSLHSCLIPCQVFQLVCTIAKLGMLYLLIDTREEMKYPHASLCWDPGGSFPFRGRHVECVVGTDAWADAAELGRRAGEFVCLC